jgi:DNA-binding NarL/FixJ family response regulator
MAKEISIVIMDDHPVFLRGLRLVIESDSALRIVGEARNGDEGLAQVALWQPDVAVVDIDMPERDGFSVARAMVLESPRTALIFLTMHDDEAIFNAALNLGAKGYILKDGALGDIVAGVKTVMAGRNYITPKLSTYLINRSSEGDAEPAPPALPGDLTPTEKRVLCLVADGQATKDIAAALFISPRTVDHHRANICGKLGLRGANALLKFAVANKAGLLGS